MDVRRVRKGTQIGGTEGGQRYRGSRAIRTAVLIGVASVAVLSAAHQPTAEANHLQAQIDWRMADHFGLDENSDGMIDYFPDITPETFRVTLDGC